CDGAGNVAAFNAWKNGATAGDVCSGTLTPTYVEESNTPDCGATRVIKAHWSVTDACGNSGTSVSRTFTIEDTTAPVVTAPADKTVECDGAGNLAELNSWKNGATANDTCSGAATPTYVEESNTPGCGATRVIKAHWTATDACGNPGTSVTRTFTIVDTTGPVITTAAANQTVECDGAGNTTAYA